MWKTAKRNLLATLLAILFLGCLGSGLWLWRDTETAAPKRPTLASVLNIDDRLIETARQMAQLADTAEEQDLAREAFRLSDHAYDRLFAIAILEAALTPPPSTPQLKEINARIESLKRRIAQAQQRIDTLSKGPQTDEAMTRLEVARAELALDQGELAEAQADLSRNGGNRRANLERLRKQYADGQHAPTFPPLAPPADTSSLIDEYNTWTRVRTRADRVTASQQLAMNIFAAHLHRRQGLSSGAAAAKQQIEADQEDSETEELLERLHKLSGQREIVTHLDQTTQDAQSIAAVYQRWRGVLETRARLHLRRLLLAMSVILAVLLAVVMVGKAVRRTFRNHADRRHANQMRVMLSIAAQVVGCLLVALIMFGPPTQISTIIGLATAGLSVVLKDFIVAFFGWFILMGKNGVRIGDWVEIEGVGGEVVEIGLLKTVLLEMGNLSNTGHHTGRHVSFVNKYAIERHFFNFSTAGQWLWDELQISLPPTSDAYMLSSAVRDLVEKETEADAKQAEADWERVTRKYETSSFSARPVVDLRPSPNGLDVAVRYITRAPQRYAVKSHLLQLIVAMIHSPGKPA